MLSVTELRAGTTFTIDRRIYEVMHYQHIKMGRGGAVIRLRVRDVESGAVLERTFKNNEQVFEADIALAPAQFLFRDGERSVFMETETFEQSSVEARQIGEAHDFLTEGMAVTLLKAGGRVVSVRVPAKVELEVVETSPRVKGATISQVTKPAKLLSGATVYVPSFIRVGDRIRVNTQTRKYLERA